MSEQITLYELERDYRPRRSRRLDHATSERGATDVAFRANSQKARLVIAYAQQHADALADASVVDALSDEQAARRAGLSMRSCFWKRCGELRDLELIEFTGDTITGSQGSPCGLSRITSDGLELARRLLDDEHTRHEHPHLPRGATVVRCATCDSRNAYELADGTVVCSCDDTDSQ